jgi:hypothetical protein
MAHVSHLSRLALAAPIAALAFAAPAAAQDQAGDRVNMVIAYDESECPEPTTDSEIVICEILVEADRFRIPSNLRYSDSPENVARTRQIESIRYIGAFGTLSCDPAGAGGFTGCTEQFIDQAYAEKEGAESVRFSQLIEEARQDRLSTIDGDAAAEQSRVEQIEREYLDRLERERAGSLPGEDAASGPSLSAPPASDVGPVQNPDG